MRTGAHHSVWPAVVAVLVTCSAAADVATAPGTRTSLAPSARIREIAGQITAYDGISNSDETVRVSGEAFNAVDKQIVLGFVEDVRTRLEMLTGTSFSGGDYRVSVFAETAEADRPAVVDKRLMPPRLGRQRLPTIRLSVTNPSKLDPRLLARELCDGYLSMKVLVLSGPERPPAPPARWFTAGLARYLDPAARQDDAEDVLASWQSARLPPLGVLAARRSPHASANAAVAAQLVAWWLDFPDRGRRLEVLCQALASGRPWSPALFVETAQGRQSLIHADRVFDVWLLKRRDSVLTPGRTRQEFVVRAYYALTLHPGETGVPDDVPAFATPDLLVSRLDEPWTQRCARFKAEQIMRLAAGRGDSFRKAAAKYAEFFDGVVRREPAGRLRATLRLAELMLGDSEEQPE